MDAKIAPQGVVIASEFTHGLQVDCGIAHFADGLYQLRHAKAVYDDLVAVLRVAGTCSVTAPDSCHAVPHKSVVQVLRNASGPQSVLKVMA